MHFALLNESHANALLAFESSNKDFFESFIAPRPPDFYSHTGVENHIAGLLSLHDSLRTRSFVLLNKGAIVARSNIKNIQPGHIGEIGYRVEEAYIGQGLATRSVQHLMREATAMKLRLLNAVVLDNNRASESVLIKNGFDLSFCSINQYRHQSRILNAFHYQRHLTTMPHPHHT